MKNDRFPWEISILIPLHHQYDKMEPHKKMEVKICFHQIQRGKLGGMTLRQEGL